ncbi:hypothetical protein MCEMKE14_00425 [Candidatus Nanopelagicaceae bacterium]
MTAWVELHLFYVVTEKCLICAKIARIYQWPRPVKLNESSTGCLSCLHEWLDYLTPASEIRPIQIHNGKPVLILSASLAPRRRGAYECAHCGQTFYGVERLTAHRRRLNRTVSTEDAEYERVERSVAEASNSIESAIIRGDKNACRDLAKSLLSVLKEAEPILEGSPIFIDLEELIAKAQEIAEKN